MLDEKYLLSKKFELYSNVYEKYVAKRTFINVEIIGGKPIVSLEINHGSLTLSHIKTNKQLEDLYLCLSDKPLI